MSRMKDASETLSTSTQEFLRLQREVEHLQQENRVLHIRAQGVQVLGKVLQDSQDSNAKLKQEIEQLKSHLVQKGIDAAQADLSVCTVHDDGDHQSANVEQVVSCHSSVGNSSTGIPDYVNVTTVSGPQSLSAGFPSLLPGEFHMKEIQVEFQHINCELDQLIKETCKLLENIERLPGDDRNTELQGRLTRLSSKLNEYAKQARTRETLSSALVSEEEKIRAKLVTLEEEQASHENVVQDLKVKLDKSKEEIGQIQGEVKFSQEAVHVKREQKTIVAHNEPLFDSSEKTAAASRSTSNETIIEKTPLLQCGPKTCEGCNQLQLQTTELQRQLLAVKAEKDEALKLKEEILDVNHKWDAQYKMLVAATNKEISDLKQQIEFLSSGDSQMKYGHFLEPAVMERRALDQRCKQLENELQQKQLEINHLQLLMRNQSGHKQPPTPQSFSMDQHPSLLGAAALSTGASALIPSQGLPSWPGTTSYSQQIPAEVIDQIEVLKQQLRIYADDFATEREDRERNQAEKEKMKEELNTMKEQVQALEQQVQIYEEDFKREKREKEILQQQLRSSYSGGGYQYRDPLSERARAVAEQQARVQAIREVHDRERDRLLIGQQELQQHVYGQQHGSFSRAQSQYNPSGRGWDYTTQEWRRQNYPLVPRGSFPARGPIAHPASQIPSGNSMYHGGEVMPDRVEDVVDSLADGSGSEAAGTSDKDKEEVVQLEECPRCLRRFDGEDNDTILKHIERCIS